MAWPSITEGVTKATKGFFEEIKSYITSGEGLPASVVSRSAAGQPLEANSAAVKVSNTGEAAPTSTTCPTGFTYYQTNSEGTVIAEWIGTESGPVEVAKLVPAIGNVVVTGTPSVGYGVVATGAEAAHWASISGAAGVKSGFFGSGSDGEVVMNGTNEFAAFSTKASKVYTLTRNVYATNLKIESGCTLERGNFIVYCTGEYLLASGCKDKQPAFNGSPATTTTGGGSSGHEGNGILAGGAAGGKGATAGGAAAEAGTAFASSGGPNMGGTGGVGGNGTSQNGAAAGTPNTAAAEGYPAMSLQALVTGLTFCTNGVKSINGGTGGGGGGADAGTSGGGGGGEAGGVHITVAAIFNNLGTIECNGGHGGNANTAGTGGGGGGGGGGFVAVVTNSVAEEGIIQTEGGTSSAGNHENGKAGSKGKSVVLLV